MVEPRTEDDSGTQGRMRSPEEVARGFLEEGGSVDPLKAEGPRLRVWNPGALATAAGVVAALAILVVLAVLTLAPSRTPSPPSAAGVTLPAPTSVTVAVQSTLPSGALLAIQTDQRLTLIGFHSSGVGFAPNIIAVGEPSEIHYGPSGLRAAETLTQWLTGPVEKVFSAQLSGNNLELWIASPQLGVKAVTTTTTTTLSPGQPSLP